MPAQATTATSLPDRAQSGPSVVSYQVLCAVLCAAIFVAVASAPASAAIPEGVWLLDGKVAVRIFECDSLMCGSIVWLQIPNNLQDSLNSTDTILIRRCASVGYAG